MAKVIGIPATINAKTTQFKIEESHYSTNSIKTNTVIDAFNSARGLMTEISDLSTKKAFELENSRMAIVELRTDFEGSTFPYCPLVSRHDLHYGRAAFISTYLDAYYAAAMNHKSDDIPSKKGDVIMRSQLSGFDTILNIFGNAYGKSAMTAKDLIISAGMIGEAYGTSGNADASVGMAILILLSIIGKRGGGYITGFMEHAIEIFDDTKLDIFQEVGEDKYGALLYEDVAQAVLYKTGELSCALGILSEEKGPCFSTDDLVTIDYGSVVGYYCKLLYKSYAKSVDEFIDIFGDKISA